MEDSRSVLQKQFALGDAAVDGLLNGIAAGIVMAAYLVLAGLVAGEGPAAVLGRFDASPAGDPLRGALMHLAASAVYGVLFGLLWRFVSRGAPNFALSIFAGLLYGLVLFAVAERIILPAGSSSLLLAFPAWSFGVAHAVYGITLGLLTIRLSK